MGCRPGRRRVSEVLQQLESLAKPGGGGGLERDKLTKHHAMKTYGEWRYNSMHS
jgi:hypothetical protein